MAKVQPVGYRALIQHEKEEKTKGGLILPENVSHKGTMALGVVKAVGKSKRVKVGDRVFFRKMAVNELEIDGQEFSLIDTKHILAINNE
jgi:co-chaperonin GroES (HSP10)